MPDDVAVKDADVTSADRREAPLTGVMLWAAAVILASANFMAVLDMTVANVALPTIAGSLGISPTQSVWIITSYAVAEAVAVPLTGWLAGRFGAVRVMAITLAMFGVFSLLCGLSNTLTLLVIGRIMQGWSGGLMMALSQTLLLRVFPPAKAGAAMALWALATLVAPIMGPVVGGWLCETLSWPLIFFINVPIAAVSALVIWRLLRRYEIATVRLPIDVVGLVLLVVFVGALQVMLDIGKEHDWFESWNIRILCGVAVVGFFAFLIWELTASHPIVDLRVFRHRGFATAASVQGLIFGAMFGGNVLMPIWLQNYMNYSAVESGLVNVWSACLGFIVAPLSGLLIGKVDGRKMIFFGLLWAILSMWLRSHCTPDMGYWQVSIPMLLFGGGMTMAFVPLTTLTVASVNEEETASATGLQNFIRTLSGAVAAALVTTAWENRIAQVHAALSGSVDRNGMAMGILTATGMTRDMALRQMDQMLEHQSAIIAFNQVMLAVTAVFVVCAFSIWLVPKPRRTVDLTQAGH